MKPMLVGFKRDDPAVTTQYLNRGPKIDLFPFLSHDDPGQLGHLDGLERARAARAGAALRPI